MNKKFIAGILSLCMAGTLVVPVMAAEPTQPQENNISFFISLPGNSSTLSNKGEDYLFLTYGGSIKKDAIQTSNNGYINLEDENSIKNNVAEWPQGNVMTSLPEGVTKCSSNPVGEGSSWKMDENGNVTDFILNVEGQYYSSNPQNSSDGFSYNIRWAKYTTNAHSFNFTDGHIMSTPHIDGILYKTSIPVDELINPNAEDIMKVLNKKVENLTQTETFNFVLNKTEGFDAADFKPINLTATISNSEEVIGLDFVNESDRIRELSPGIYEVKEVFAADTKWETPQSIIFEVYTNGDVNFTNGTTITNKLKEVAPTPTPSPGGGGHKPSLNKENHYAYIIGYPDGTIGPMNNITRAETATIFFRLLTEKSRGEYWSTENNYSDVDSSKWFNNAISTLSNAEILKGYSNNTFQPNAFITRAEFAVIASRFDSSQVPSDYEKPFSDVPITHWAYNDIQKAAYLGYIKGYEDGTFHPNDYITRAEAMTLLNRVLNRNVTLENIHKDAIQWSDISTVAWYYTDVIEATNSHEYTRKNNDKSNPEKWTKINSNPDWKILEETH